MQFAQLSASMLALIGECNEQLCCCCAQCSDGRVVWRPGLLKVMCDSIRAGGTEDARDLHSKVLQQWCAGACESEHSQGAAHHL